MSRILMNILRVELAMIGFMAGASIGEAVMWDKSPANDAMQSARVENYDAEIKKLKTAQERIERLDRALAAPELLSVLNPDNKDMKKQFDTATAYLAKERVNYKQGAYNVSYGLVTDSGLDEEKAADLYKSLTAMADKDLQKELDDKATAFNGLRECRVQFAGQAGYGANQKTAALISNCADDVVNDTSNNSGYAGAGLLLAASFASPALRRRRLEPAKKKPQKPQDRNVDVQVVVKRKGP